MQKFLLSVFLLIVSFSLRAQVPDFKLNRTFGTPVFFPYDIAVDKANYMYVLERDQINKIDPSGTLVKTIALHVADHPGTSVSLALDETGNMYVLNTSYSVIQKYNPQGELLLQFGAYGSEPGQFKYPNGIAVDKSGNIYVAEKENDRIQKFNAQGGFIIEFKLPNTPSDNYNNPIALKIGKSGIIYFLTEDYRLFKLNSNGKFLESFKIIVPDYEDTDDSENTLALDESENIYVSSVNEGRIHKLTSSGQYLLSFGSVYTDRGYFTGTKLGITTSQNGDVYVADRTHDNTSTIQIFNSTGKFKKKLGTLDNYIDITQDNQGNYYLLSNYSKSYIKKLNSLGQFINQFGSVGGEDEYRPMPVAIKADITGNVYLLESDDYSSRILKFNKDGIFLTKFDDFGNDAGLKRFSDLALDTQGNMYVTDFYGGYVRKVSSSGKFLRLISSRGAEKGKVYLPKALTVDVKGNIYVADYDGDRIQKFNPTGELLMGMNSSTNSADFVTDSPTSIDVDRSGNVYIWNSFNNFIRQYDASGKEITKIKGASGAISINSSGTKMLLTYGALVWEYLSQNATKQSFITGKIYQDTNKNCQLDATEKPLPGIVVTAEPGPYYGVSDEQGSYAIPVDTGRYIIKTILPKDVGRTITPTCPAVFNEPTYVSGYGTLTTGPDFGNQVSTSPVLNVEVASNRRRRCFRSTTTVSYANTGFAAARNAKVMVQLPEYVSFISASVPYSRDSKGNYIFAVGELQPNQRGTITIIDSVSCNDPSIRGLTVCTKAWITPVNTYPAPANWNKAEISVNGKITQDGQARFVIQNQGQGDMTDSLAFRVFQDFDLVLKSKYKLAAGDSLVLRFMPTGRVVRVEVDQPEGHPLKASAGANVEIKSKNVARVPAPLMMAYPPDDPEPEISEDCQPIVDSFDPNDKQVIPAGVTSNHYTPTNTPLRYTIRFQNTGTDVAYRVVVVDTLSTDLDLSTLQVGAVSHAYTLTISGKNKPILTFTFDNILLPDSSKNQAGSNGYVQFSVKPKSNLPQKIKIENYADIFFDYNEPVRTNTTINRIFDMPQTVNLEKQLNASQIINTPAITQFTPNQSRSGQLVTITGKHFAANAAENTVTFNGVKAKVISSSSTQIMVLVPATAFSGKIKVITPDGAAQSATDYIIFQPPVITSVSANEGKPGERITLTGNYFSAESLQDTVLFNGVRAKVTAALETSLQVEVPQGATSGKILIKTNGRQVESTQLFQIWYPPVIKEFNPDKGKAGIIVTLKGDNFAEDANRNSVQFNGTSAEVIQASATQLRVKVPVNAPSGKILVQTSGGIATTLTSFTFIPAPIIYSFSPASGNAGTTVILTGTHFNADGQTDTVLFNNQPAKILKISATELIVQVPKGVQSGRITVAGAGGKATSNEFVVLDLNPEDAVSIYPNPTPSTVTLNWYKANFKAESLAIYNAVGKRVMQKDLKIIPNDELQLSLSFLPAGFYTFRIQSNEGVILKRVVLL
ncbi:hypothetical protein AHMF7605_24975 [Adhaeribacter arboris]|uniref:IPT/TIG domain-containing protein n=1 Tax=Adhaeribacter arboris TaxID=2072846 RepID=A0A2T2YM18_9BACT|nr:IPT/TIG domain-containing protein [Adhaeribacter arboris]PSR56515.1 hypothetical protein AHMF7605_24975 [Adhaeribacter arboris]